MRVVLLLMGLAVQAACATTATTTPPDEPDRRERCDAVSTLRVQSRVEGARLLIESVVTEQVCEGESRVLAPVRLAEVRLRPDLPACPVGHLAARLSSLAFETEPALAGFFETREPRERVWLQQGLSSFASNARAWVIGCPEGRPLEWLFVETDRLGDPLRVAFSDGARVRFAPGHENVVFPAPPPPPVVAEAPPPLPAEGDEPSSEPLPPEPPPPTAAGCPAEAVDAQWVARRFGSSARPPGLRLMPGPETLDQWRLRLDGTAATLVHEVDRRPQRGPDAGVWGCHDATTVKGSVERRGRTLTLTFGGLVATCREEVVSLRPAGAKRQPRTLPQRRDEEGCDRYPWATTARRPTTALVCTGPLPLDALSLFAPPPGLERLVLSNDCQETSAREALRLVPADGGVAPAL
jgi:hypothetical protein